MRHICIKSTARNVFVRCVIKFLICYCLHGPNNEGKPHPGSSCIKTLHCVVTIEWIKEKESDLSVVLWGAECIE